MYIDVDTLSVIGIVLAFFIMFCILLFGDVIYDTIAFYYDWLKSYLLIFLMFSIMVLISYPDYVRMGLSIFCIPIILYAFRLTYRNKYLKGFKSLPPVKEDKKVNYYSTDKYGNTTICAMKIRDEK